MAERIYVRRRGRLTRGQTRAMATLANRYRIDSTFTSKFQEGVFDRPGQLGLEIGFGMGHALLDWAQAAPDWNLFGIDVYQPGVGALLLGLERLSLSNVKVIESSAEVAFENYLTPDCLDEVRIFFPDPWPKKRHHKRRLIQKEFVALLASRLKPGAHLRLATDWEPYAHWMLSILQHSPDLINSHGEGFAERMDARPTTNFEARGERLGHSVWDLDYRRRSADDAD